ncbi:MAG: hypothetical protein NUV81_03545 [bacterium]|nr:hypothetical protein [bacterium]
MALLHEAAEALPRGISASRGLPQRAVERLLKKGGATGALPSGSAGIAPRKVWHGPACFLEQAWYCQSKFITDNLDFVNDVYWIDVIEHHVSLFSLGSVASGTIEG